MASRHGKESTSQADKENKGTKGKDGDKANPSGLAFALLIVSVFSAMFLVSLVR